MHLKRAHAVAIDSSAIIVLLSFGVLFYGFCLGADIVTRTLG